MDFSKTISGNGGSGSQEPYYTLVFEGDIKQNKDWDVIFEEVTKGGRRVKRTTKKRRIRKRRKTVRSHK